MHAQNIIICHHDDNDAMDCTTPIISFHFLIHKSSHLREINILLLYYIIISIIFLDFPLSFRAL